MNSKEFIKALDAICAEKNIKKELVLDAMQQALAAGYKRNFNALTNVKVDINPTTGDIKVYSFRTVVSRYDKEEENYEEVQLTLAKAKKINPDIKVGETIEEEVTPEDFGRVATSTVKQVLTQKIREAERESIMHEFEDKNQELLVGTLSREDAVNYYVDLGRTHGILPKEELVPGEVLKMGSSIRVFVAKIDNSGKAPLILLSRTHYGYVKRLLELEIPELNDGTVILYSVAREPGNRSKIAVFSENKQVDAVGACIGERGSRITRIMNELNGEKIDVIEYSKDPAVFIANALSPAKNVAVYIADEKAQTAIAVANGDDLPLSIGKRGQNVRLAARLTRYRIDVKTSQQIIDERIDLSSYKSNI